MISGYDSHTKDTAFTIGLQGISMEKADEIETVVLDTFEKAAQTGFEEDRIQAILNKMELSLKKQKNNFGWSLIMSLTPGWNHVDDPLTLLRYHSYTRGCLIIIWTGLNIKIGIAQKVYELCLF